MLIEYENIQREKYTKLYSENLKQRNQLREVGVEGK
jgi:hypothetical protein